MRSILIFSFLFLQIFCACNNNKESNPVTTSENDVDAARNFIRAALDGHYDKARALVVADSVNNAWIDLFERNYKSRMSLGDKAGYRTSSINIHNIKSVNDSTSIINYSNSFKKKDDSLKVVRQNGAWLVDLKYSFPTQPVKDSLLR